MINRAGAVLLAVAVFVLIALVAVFQIGDRNEWELRESETRLQQTIEAAETALSTVKDVETGQRGFLITGKGEYLEPYINGLEVLDSQLQELQSLASNHVDSARLVSVFIRAIRAKIGELRATVESRLAGQQGLALARLMQGEGLLYMSRARELEQRLVQLERDRIAATRAQIAADERFARISIFAGFAVLFLLLTAGTVMLAREAQREATLAAGLEQSEQRYRSLAASLEQQVQSRTQELQAVNRELEAFSFSVSHDLRAPLRSIDGFSHIILEDYADKLDDEGRKLLERIRSATARMGQLIKSLLELSRVNRNELHRENVSLASMADTILDSLRLQDPDRKISIHVEPDLAANADPELLHVVLDNLLSNAWKFTSREPNPCIEVGSILVPPSGPKAFFVRDNGTGFDPAYADRLYTPFQRLHSSSEFEGIGIGLATVKRVIHRHGGDIWATSSPGAGATFFFTLA